MRGAAHAAGRRLGIWLASGRTVAMWDELKRLLKHTTIYGVGSIVGKLVGFLLIPFYTHYLRPSEYGTLELLDLSVAFIGLLLNVWVTIPLVRFYYDHDEQSERNKIVSTILLAVAAVATALAVTGLAFAREVSWLILRSPEFGLYVRVISISFFLSSINSVAWNYMRARQRSSLIVSLNLASLALAICLNIYFIAFLHLGVLGVLYSSLLAHVLNTSLLMAKMLPEIGWHFDWVIFSKVMAFGAPLIFTALGAFVMNYSDRFFLERFGGVGVVGVYALGYKFGYMLSFLVIQPFYMIWSARMYEIAKQDNALEMFARLGAYFSFALTVAALGVALPIREVIHVISASDFHSAYRIVPIIALAYVFQGLTYYFQTGILIQKKTAYMGAIGLAGAAADLALNFLLIPRYHAMGAAWATVLSFLVVASLAFFFSQKVYPIPYRLPKLCMPVVIGAAFYLASGWIRVPSLWLSACFKLALIPPLYLVALHLLGFFDRGEVDQAKIFVGGLWARYRSSGAVLTER
jgi:O-antigen/teichoic acid export membrane protein